MKAKKPQQKLVSFSENDVDFENIEKQIADGWRIVSVMPNHSTYLCILEKAHENENAANHKEGEYVYIPPRKKIKIIK